MKRIISLFIAILSIGAVFTSCNTNTVYNKYVTLPEDGWYKNNAVAFNININDSLTNYEFALDIRNTTNYRYSNLYVFLITEFPNGNISRDTIECLLANYEGKWLGKGWGEIKENRIILKSGLRFPLTGDYRFLIQQAMRVDTLKGIQNVGLSLVIE
ncbi:MAG: gliding motility lipoprotein GldH [Bacteroidota bacterium]